MSLKTIIAKYDGETVVTGTLQSLFPRVSFPSTGPDQDWRTAHGIYDIQTKPHTSNQISTSVTPYYESGAVYNNVVTDKTEEQIYNDTMSEFASALALAKSAKMNSILSVYYTKEEDGFRYNGVVYQINNAAQNNMVATQARFNRGIVNSHGGYWRGKDNVKYYMTDEEVQVLFDLSFQYKSSLIRNLHDLKDDLLGSETLEEVNAIDEYAGWPAVEE